MKKILVFLSFIFSAPLFAQVEVIVHPSNANAISKAEIARIFLGKTRAFPSGQEAIPVTLGEGDAAAQGFSKDVLGKSPKQLKAYWAKMVFTGKGTPPKVVSSAAELVDLVSNNPNLIGFVPAGSSGGKVKVVGKF